MLTPQAVDESVIFRLPSRCSTSEPQWAWLSNEKYLLDKEARGRMFNGNTVYDRPSGNEDVFYPFDTNW